MQTPSFSPLVLALACLSTAVWTGPSEAESGALLTIPSAPPTAGLQMELDTRWPYGSGYHPVRVTVRLAPAANAVAQRTLRIELRPDGVFNLEPTVVSQYLEIPEGQPEGSIAMLVPQTGVWQSVQLRTYEDGYELPELSGRFALQRAARSDLTEYHPAVLFVHPQAPTLKQRTELLEQWRRGSAPPISRDLPWVDLMMELTRGSARSGRQAHPTDIFVLNSVDSDKKAGLLPPGELPANWLALTGVDLVCIPLDTLLSLPEKHAPQWDALQRWTNAGGTLVIFGEDMRGRLGETAEAFGASAGAVFEGADPWLPPAPDHDINSLLTLHSNTSRSRVQLPPAARRTRPPRATDVLWTRRQGLGLLAAVAAKDVGDLTPRQRLLLLNSITPQRWAWYQRHGLSMMRDSTDYGEYAIPGVGEPPLLSFLATITLYVILLGPVNYLLLRRAQRLYLLLVTVPLGAGVITAALFLFALYADGLGVRVLVRSFSVLDQRTGQMASWARQTYYAGLRPSRGLSFSSDTAVLPISMPGTDLHEERRRDPRELLWDDQQRLTEGYLSSRNSEQFLAMRAGPTEAGLDIQTGPPLKVTNRLGAHIDLLVLGDANGSLYYAEQIPAGDSAALASVAVNQASGMLRQLIVDRQPEGRQPTMSYFGRWANRQMDQGQPTPAFESGLLESNVAELPHEVLRQGYIAILDQCPLTEIGTRASLETGGFHAIRGRW